MATTTTAEHFPGHTISLRSRPMAKPYNVVPVKFEATIRLRSTFRLTTLSPEGLVANHDPSSAKFDATTTTAEHTSHTISPRFRPVAKPYNVVPVKFEATTTTAEHFPAHHVESPKRLVAKSYSPSSAKFDATTTTAEHYPGHDARKRAPVGIAVANDEFLTMLHGGVEVPTQAAKVFTTTVDGQASCR